MWTRIGGRYSAALAWAGLFLLLAPFVLLSIVSRDPEPAVFITLVFGAWVLTGVAAYMPVIALKVVSILRARYRGQ